MAPTRALRCGNIKAEPGSQSLIETLNLTAAKLPLVGCRARVEGHQKQQKDGSPGEPLAEAQICSTVANDRVCIPSINTETGLVHAALPWKTCQCVHRLSQTEAGTYPCFMPRATLPCEPVIFDFVLVLKADISRLVLVDDVESPAIMIKAARPRKRRCEWHTAVGVYHVLLKPLVAQLCVYVRTVL